VPVYAIAAGVVKKADRITVAIDTNGDGTNDTTLDLGYGVMIKHELPHEIAVAAFLCPGTTLPPAVVGSDKVFTSGYMHLKNVTVLKDDVVIVGQKIGEIGPLASGAHLHLEINWDELQIINFPAYQSSPQAVTNRGLLDPLLFIQSRIRDYSIPDFVGVQEAGFNSEVRRSFEDGYMVNCSNSFFGPPSAVGTNTTVYVHAWGTDIANRPLLVQDFLRPLLGGRSYWSQLQYNRTLGTALPVHGKILEMYARCKNDGSCISNYPSTHDFGAPRNTEYYCVLPTFTYYRPGQEEHFALNRFVRQDFDNIFIG